MRARLAPIVTLAVLVVAAGAARGADRRLAPIPHDQARSSHGPYEMGACDTCHARNDPRNPGPASTTNDSCFECHDEFKGGAQVRMEKRLHPRSVGTNCVGCHTPHNSRHPKLLLHT